MLFIRHREDYYAQLDNHCYVAVRFLFFQVPNLADLILLIMSYDNDYKAYFILRIITQIFYFLLCLAIALCASYVPGDYGMDALIYIYPCFCLGICVFGLEIPCLLFFIKYYNELLLLSKIGYFIHWIFIPCLIIYSFIAYKLYNKEVPRDSNNGNK